MRAGPSWVVLAGLTQASMVISSLPWQALITFVAGPTEAISVAESTTNPPPEIQLTALPSLISRSSGAPTPETSCTVVPLPSLKV